MSKKIHIIYRVNLVFFSLLAGLSTLYLEGTLLGSKAYVIGSVLGSSSVPFGISILLMIPFEKRLKSKKGNRNLAIIALFLIPIVMAAFSVYANIYAS